MKKTIIVSLDSLGETDKEIFESMDGFSYLIENGAYIKSMEPVYPSLTYPCHASMISGAYPRETGIVSNHLLQPSKENKDWYWFEKDIKSDTIFRAAKRKDLRLGTIRWPVGAMSGADKIIPEILPHGLVQSQSLAALLYGTPITFLEMEQKYGDKRDGMNQPQLDNYVEACLKDFILDEDLDIVAAHFLALDAKKHEFGLGSDQVRGAIESYNQRIKSVLGLVREEKIDANIFFISDHSQLQASKGIRLNKFLTDKGYIQIQVGKIFKYKYYMQENGGSAYIYSRKSTSEEDKTLFKELKDLNKKEDIFDAIYSSEEARDMGADPECLFMIEAKNGYSFIDGHAGALIEENTGFKASHGYRPDKKDYGSVLFAIGPDIKNISLERGRIIDVGPTIARLLDLDLRGAQGTSLDILK